MPTSEREINALQNALDNCFHVYCKLEKSYRELDEVLERDKDYQELKCIEDTISLINFKDNPYSKFFSFKITIHLWLTELINTLHPIDTKDPLFTLNQWLEKNSDYKFDNRLADLIHKAAYLDEQKKPSAECEEFYQYLLLEVKKVKTEASQQKPLKEKLEDKAQKLENISADLNNLIKYLKVFRNKYYKVTGNKHQT